MRGLEYGLAVADVLLSLFVFFPLSILHWRGTWQLQDVYILPDNLKDSSWISLGVGLNLCLAELLFQPLLKNNLDREKRVRYFVVSRLHLYIHGWGVMCYWRGMWNLLDFYLTSGWINSTILYGVGQVITMAVCVSRTNVGIPVSLSLDTDPDLLEPDTVFKVSPERSVLFLLDCLFAQVVIVTCNVVIWRGIWNIVDVFLLPRHHVESDVISLLLGYAVLGMMFLLQVPTALVSAALDGFPRPVKLVYEDVIFLVAEWANLLLWRGGWDLCVKYVIPDPLLGSWVSHAIGSVGLISLQVFSNVGLNGIEYDGAYTNGEGIYPVKYLRVYLEHKFKKKRQANRTYHKVENGGQFQILDSDSDDSIFESDVMREIEAKHAAKGTRAHENGGHRGENGGHRGENGVREPLVAVNGGLESLPHEPIGINETKT